MKQLYKLCALIPVYNHGATVSIVVDSVLAQGLNVILIDDGSDSACKAILENISRERNALLLRRPRNGGKGAAVLDGLHTAAKQGYSHALQIDADGQHALHDIAHFSAVSREQPEALICGAPIYGDDAPRARLYGRWLTRIWVWINTLSLDIPDAMCGFRIYPLNRTLSIVDGASVGQRMDFDISIIVHLHWKRVPMVWLPTRVSYPQNGVSHFNGLRDNLLISREHARLFFGMLWRAPCLLTHRLIERSRT